MRSTWFSVSVARKRLFPRTRTELVQPHPAMLFHKVIRDTDENQSDHEVLLQAWMGGMGGRRVPFSSWAGKSSSRRHGRFSAGHANTLQAEFLAGVEHRFDLQSVLHRHVQSGGDYLGMVAVSAQTPGEKARIE